MRTHYDMRREAVEGVSNLIFFATQHGDTSGVNACERKLTDSERRFSKGEFEGLKEIVEHVAKLRALNTQYDNIPDGETESVCNEVEAEEDWLAAQSKIFKKRFGHLLLN